MMYFVVSIVRICIKDILHVSEWNASRKCVECAQLPKVTDLKYMGSTQHNDGDMNAVAALITLFV